MASDHVAVLNPDVDTPFLDTTDVLNRLLPYHVFQQPKEDLEAVVRAGKAKGKRKATGEELANEIAGTYAPLIMRSGPHCYCRNQVCIGVFQKAEGSTGPI